MTLLDKSTMKCDSADRPIHDEGTDGTCPICMELRAKVLAEWRPPRWQLLVPTAQGTRVFDYDRKPWNPIVRIAMYLRGYRWQRFRLDRPGWRL